MKREKVLLPLQSQLYGSTMRPVLLYGCETWPIKQALWQYWLLAVVDPREGCSVL